MPIYPYVTKNLPTYKPAYIYRLTHTEIYIIFIHINLCIWRAIHTCRFVSLGILMHMHHTCPAANPYTCLAEGSGRLCYYTELSHNLPDQLVGLSIICGKYHSMHARSYAYTCTHTQRQTYLHTDIHTKRNLQGLDDHLCGPEMYSSLVY